MAVFLGNKYQSKQRDNFRKIAGISENGEKIEVENKERILGQAGVAWIAGNNPASETTGQPDDNNCCEKQKDDEKEEQEENNNNDDPNNPKPNEPDEPDEPDNPYECKCVSVSSPYAANACCVTGKDCETGGTVRIQRKGGNSNADCGGGDDCIIMPLFEIYYLKRFRGCNEFWQDPEITEICLQDKNEVLALRDAMLEKLKGEAEACCGRELEPTRNEITNGGWGFAVQFSFTHNGWGNVGSVDLSPKNSICSEQGCENRKKYFPEPKDYFIENGRIYNSCDQYGEPPMDCVEICDENGNKYRVCGDGTITPL